MSEDQSPISSGIQGIGQVIQMPVRVLGAGVRGLQRVLDVVSLARLKPGTESLGLIQHRVDSADAAVLLVHGFGVCERTWGELPQMLCDEPALDGWDVYSVGYETGLAPDLSGIWSADPDIGVLATYLRSRMRLEPLKNYRALALVAHSMGGLVVQRALLDDSGLVARASHVVMFGTPSDGLVPARWGGFLKAQIRDMGKGSEFLADLRRRWDAEFATLRPFKFWVVAGDRDVFVPAWSSLDPFPIDTQVVIPGNHLEICNISDPAEMSVEVLVDALVGEAAPGGPWNAARVAVERREFHRAVELLLPHVDELDDQHLVTLAIALDETGKRDRAIALLREHGFGTDARGVLAGRLKRAWMAEGRERDGEEAVKTYHQAYQESVAAGDHAQASYLGINIAYLELVFRDDPDAAAEQSLLVLDHCEQSPAGYWRAATEGEAHLYLGNPEQAMVAYREAVAAAPSPRELVSMHTQASWVAARKHEPGLQGDLDDVFRTQTQ